MIFYCARDNRGTAMIVKRLDDFEDGVLQFILPDGSFQVS